MSKLTNTAIKKALQSPGRHSDGNGLHLVTTRPGTASWVARLQKNGRRRDFGLGSFADVSASTARERITALRAQLAAGLDPIAERQKASGTPTFKEAAIFIHSERQQRWRNGKHQQQWLNTLQTYAFPRLGAMKLQAITLADITAVLSPIWLEKPETARRVAQRLGIVLDWAFLNGHRETEAPMRSILRLMPQQPRRDGHHAAMPIDELPTFFARLNEAENVTRLALKLVILTAARSGELRGATWDEIDLDKRLWIIPAHRMKASREHVVPLSPSAVAVFQRAQEIRTGETELVFPGLKRGRPLSDMALTKLLRDWKLPYTIHGFRSTFRDWVSEETDFADEVAERALAHQVPGKTQRAYSRTDLLEKRKMLMSDWAAFCTSVMDK